MKTLNIFISDLFHPKENIYVRKIKFNYQDLV